MQLKEIRDLFVLFLKQLQKDDLNLLLNYMPIFLEDMQRDPMLLDKIPTVNLINLKGNDLINNHLLAINKFDSNMSSVATSNENTDGSDEENKNDENFLSNITPEATSFALKNDNASYENDESNIANNNGLSYESYDEDEDNNEEINPAISQYLEPTQSIRSRLPSHIIDYLTKMYNINKYPNSDEIYQMSVETSLTTKKIKNWFDSTRFKLKHSKKNNFTPKVVSYLMAKYKVNNNPSRNEMLEMMTELKLTESQIYNWFRYKRTNN